MTSNYCNTCSLQICMNTSSIVCVILGFAVGTKKNKGITKNKQQFSFTIFWYKTLVFLYTGVLIICCHKLVVQKIYNMPPKKWITVFLPLKYAVGV